MELLLNLFWLMLALSAVVILRRQPSFARNPVGPFRPRLFLVLGCLLALLFPVVSASDDLHPINQEMEEFSASKRIVKQPPNLKSPSWGTHSAPPAQTVAVAFFMPDNRSRRSALKYLCVPPRPTQAGTILYRGPPAS